MSFATVRRQATGRLPANQVLQLDLVLPLRDPAGLKSFLNDVYDPTSPSYRHFLTPAEFTARFGPTQEDYDAVRSLRQDLRLHGRRRLARRHGRAGQGHRCGRSRPPST